MRCPYCFNIETKVTNKRDRDYITRRRRECLKCKKRFSTIETISTSQFSIIKKDNTKEPFNIEKLRRGIEKACDKRPVAKEQIDKMINNIVLKLERKGKDVKSKDIGEMVINHLKKLDEVAYVRFSSYYKDFENAKQFKQILIKD